MTKYKQKTECKIILVNYTLDEKITATSFQHRVCFSLILFHFVTLPSFVSSFVCSQIRSKTESVTFQFLVITFFVPLAVSTHVNHFLCISLDIDITCITAWHNVNKNNSEVYHSKHFRKLKTCVNWYWL